MKPARRRSHRAPLGLVLAAMIPAALLLLPLFHLILRAGARGPGFLATTWTDPATLALAGRTLGLVAGVVLLSIVMALPLSWLVMRTDLPGRRFWAVAAALPLAFPSYVAAFTWVAAFGPRGHLQRWMAPWGVERLPDLVYGYSGAVFTLALFNYPYLYLLLIAAWASLDPAVEDSARSLGAGPWRAWRDVVLPRLGAALGGGSLLIALYTLADFGAVSIVRYDTLTVSIYNAYRALFDRSVAAVLGIGLIVLAALLVAAEALLARRLRADAPRPRRPMSRKPLGRWRPFSPLLPAIPVTLGVVVPVGVILDWTRRVWAQPAAAPPVLEAALHAVVLAAATAVGTLVLAAPVAIWSVRHGGRAAALVARFLSLSFALPGLVIALALVFFSIRAVPALYQSLPLLVLACVLRALPQGLAALRGGLLLLDPLFEHAARTLGSRPLAVARRVTLPLLRPALASGAALTFLTAVKELPATLLLRPTGFETLATRVWSAASEGIYSAAALPALVLVGIALPMVYLLLVRPVLGGSRPQ